MWAHFALAREEVLYSPRNDPKPRNDQPRPQSGKSTLGTRLRNRSPFFFRLDPEMSPQLIFGMIWYSATELLVCFFFVFF